MHTQECLFGLTCFMSVTIGVSSERLHALNCLCSSCINTDDNAAANMLNILLMHTMQTANMTLTLNLFMVAHFCIQLSVGNRQGPLGPQRGPIY